ncbi:hypothetical protein ACP70R_010604 [Stipagrostis hirtigluma subsp. patula]
MSMEAAAQGIDSCSRALSLLLLALQCSILFSCLVLFACSVRILEPKTEASDVMSGAAGPTPPSSSSSSFLQARGLGWVAILPPPPPISALPLLSSASSLQATLQERANLPPHLKHPRAGTARTRILFISFRPARSISALAGVVQQLTGACQTTATPSAANESPAQNIHREDAVDGDHQASSHHVDHPSEDDPFIPNANDFTTGDRSTHSVHERSVKPGDDSDGSDSHEDDAIWIPPEAADKEDETDHVSRYIYDDDDCDDGIQWGQSCFSTSGDDSDPSRNHREDRQKAMLKAMNGQLKILAGRFLASVGISFPEGEAVESWLDIVTSLSWEAALLIKPDGSVGKEMDPGSYIKSEVIKGLVFKKNAAHKHMPTKWHNPRLLLLRGFLGDSDVGFSSFSSMEQEKDHLEKSVSKMIEICSPNVILVEKTVSRDIQELLLKEGVTLVLDMKLNRLQRISRCSGSPIVQFSDVLIKPKLKQCDYFHIEKVVEEHNHAGEVGKGPSKTLMFLEGFHRPSGCTVGQCRIIKILFGGQIEKILLRGANIEELKKVKQVMHYTVFAAYHLVLETSFFEDQRVFLNDRSVSNEENSSTMKAGSSVIHHETPAFSNGSLPVTPKDNYASELKVYPVTSNGSVEASSDGKTSIISSTNPDALSSLENGFPN